MPWWRRNKPEAGEYGQAEPFRGLREQLLGLDPALLGLSREGGCGEVWGLIRRGPHLLRTVSAILQPTFSLGLSPRRRGAVGWRTDQAADLSNVARRPPWTRRPT